MLCVFPIKTPKQELESSVTGKMTATAVIPESALVQEGGLMTPTPVVMKQSTTQIMATNTSKPWDTYLYSDKELME